MITVDDMKRSGLTYDMPKRSPGKPKLENLGLRVQPVIKRVVNEFVSEITANGKVSSEGTLTRDIFMRGLACYIQDRKTETDKETEVISAFLRKRERASAKEVKVESGLGTESSRNRERA